MTIAVSMAVAVTVAVAVAMPAGHQPTWVRAWTKTMKEQKTRTEHPRLLQVSM